MRRIILLVLVAGLPLLVACGLRESPSPTPPPTLVPLPTDEPLPPPTDDPKLSLVPISDTAVDVYGSVELSIETALESANPYDPAALDLRVVFTAPDGETTDVGAFWYQGFDPVTRRAKGEPGWRVRFTPTVPGTWMATGRVAEGSNESKPLVFEVRPSEAAGFIRVHPSNPRHFARDDGRTFLPIGVNMGWSEDDPLVDYEAWLDAFAAAGGNTIRVWMAPWSFAVEWDDTPLGSYENRLEEAWLLDEVIRMAEARGIAVILVLINHGQFSTDVNAEWGRNPYNAANGGPLGSPEEFVTDSEARALFQQRLAYIGRRWAHAPNLFAWEWWNEVNWTPITEEALIPWIQEMTPVLQANDPYGHLITTSGHERGSAVWELPEIDFISKHQYDTRDLLSSAPGGYWVQANTALIKPLLFAEFGYATSKEGEQFDPEGTHLHNGLWATVFSGYAGTGMYWWWDHYIHPRDLWRHFAGLSAFLEGMDLATLEPGGPVVIEKPLLDRGAGASGLTLRGEDLLLVWIRNNRYTAAGVERAVERAERSGQDGSFVPAYERLENHRLVLDGLQDGDYTVELFDPQESVWLDARPAVASDGELSVNLPAFERDLALRITR